MRYRVALGWLFFAACSSEPATDAGAIDAGTNVDGGARDAGADAGADAGPATVIETIAESVTSEVLSTDIVLDATGAAHIAFAEAGRVTYLSEADGFSPEIVLDGPTLGGAVHLAERDGSVFVAVVESAPSAGTVVYERGTGSWAREVVYNASPSSTSAPILRTDTGFFVTWGAWYSGTSGSESHVVFSEHDGSAWSSTQFLTRGRPHSAALDSRGLVQAAFVSDALTQPYLSTIRDQGPTWIIYNVGPYSPDVEAQLALDDDDRPHVFFRDPDAGELVYAHSPTAGADFVLTPIEPSDTAPLGIAIDPANEPIVAYYRSSSADLVVAQKVGDAFESVAIDTDGDVGRALSVTMGDDGRLHLVYYDATMQRLRYAIR